MKDGDANGDSGPDRKERTIKTMKISTIILIFLLAIVSVGGLYEISKKHKLAMKYKKDHSTLLKTSSDEVANLKVKLETSRATLKIKDVELEKMKERIAGIKDKDDLLKRDIELYIRNTYTKVPRIVAKTIAENVVEKAKKENVSAELIVGIIEVESVFNPMAVGPKTKYGNARGLMQVMPEWAKKFNLENIHDLHDINTNITCGIKVFKIHLEEGKGKISEGLYLYVNKDRSYVDKVYRAMGKFVSFRSTVDDDEKSENGNGDEEPEKEINGKDTTDKTTTESS